MKITKNILSLLIAVFVILSAFQPSSQAIQSFGDINKDGTLSAEDARILLRCSVGLEEACEYIIENGDFDKNGKITSSDARISLRLAVKLENTACLLNGHIIKETTVRRTCTEDGYTAKECTRCTYSDIIYNENDKAQGHSFGIWQYKERHKERLCALCGEKEVSDKIKTVYLTFDDGPGPYTERLLGILRKYDVKATFFVTNQMPAYRYLLPRIAEDGHAIGVHTLTHKWSIYSGKNAYLNDFNAIHDIILKDTGIDTKIFRFPGGTNNTVSRSYSRGIMATMADYMTNEGYVYFDWNVDCGDTMGYSSSKIASSVINGIKNRKYSIVLMHDIKYNTVEALPSIIEYCRSNGYNFEVIDMSTPRVQFSPVN